MVAVGGGESCTPGSLDLLDGQHAIAVAIDNTVSNIHHPRSAQWSLIVDRETCATIAGDVHDEGLDIKLGGEESARITERLGGLRPIYAAVAIAIGAHEILNERSI